MDGRRRPASFNRAAPGAFASGGGGGMAGAGVRPTSASKRPGSGVEGLGDRWGKDRRPYQDGPGLSRQASAPSLAPNGNANMSYDSFARPSPQGHAGGYDAFARSPGLRRSASATAMGPRNSSAPGLRSGFASVPRRRPYETASAYATPEREFVGRGGGLGSGGAGSGYQHRQDALQLESRLTERLREHSLSATEGPRKPMAGTRSRVADRMGNSMYGDRMAPGNPGAHGDRMSNSMYGAHDHEDGYAPPQRGYPGENSRFDPRSDPRSSPNLHGSRGPYGSDRRGQLHASPSASMLSMDAQAHQYGSRSAQRRPVGQESFGGGSINSREATPQLRGDNMSMTGLMDSGGGMPESRLKIYSDLFEEVIERDRVFGSLLRKIKTAYDMLLLRAPAVPPFPVDASSLHHGHPHEGMDQHSWVGGQGPGSLHSNEPTTRADGGQGWEMQRENRVLKDLVERLHLELEEAVRREHRWKQKVTKLKGKVEATETRQKTPPQVAEDYHHVQAQDFYGQGVPKEFYAQANQMAKNFYANADQAHMEDFHSTHPSSDFHAMKDVDSLKRPSSQPPRFNAYSREPKLGETEQHEGGGPLNQGGLLSLSSISPTASVPPLPESFNADSARSSESLPGLPQRPTRSSVRRPDHVPTLDFSKLKGLEDEEEEEDMDGEDLEDEDMDQMQVHGKMQPESPVEYNESADEDACYPSFERCSIRDAGHICHPPMQGMVLPRSPNPVGFDDGESDDDGLPEGPFLA